MQSIYSEFKKIVSSSPDGIAVKDDLRTLTFSELEALADTIAAGFPVRNPAYVGIVMDHGVEMIASILAVLKTGAAYVPAEPSFPIEPWSGISRKSIWRHLLAGGPCTSPPDSARCGT